MHFLLFASLKGIKLANDELPTDTFFRTKRRYLVQVYLDYSATTPVDPQVIQAMQPYWQEQFANPSSPHHLGVNVEKTLHRCRHILGQILAVKPSEIYFTSGGTEANNLALQGFAHNQYQPGHIITTAIEHPSVLNPIRYLETKHNWQVTTLSVNSQGLIDISEFEASIKPETALVSSMLVNNEIGAVQDIKAISRIIAHENRKRDYNKIVFHVDACQALGKVDLDIDKANIDLLSLSAHKVGGPKGAGLLYCREPLKLQPLLYGGGQEDGLRSGTENVPAIVGMTKACQLAVEHYPTAVTKLNRLSTQLVSSLKTIPGTSFNSHALGAPHIINVQFEQVKAEVLVHFLEQKQVYVSIGAACSSHKSSLSHVLQAIGLTDEQATCSVRISLAPHTTEDEIAYAAQVFADAVVEIRTIYS